LVGSRAAHVLVSWSDIEIAAYYDQIANPGSCILMNVQMAWELENPGHHHRQRVLSSLKVKKRSLAGIPGIFPN
jgi:hypothetical protein